MLKYIPIFIFLTLIGCNKTQNASMKFLEEQLPGNWQMVTEDGILVEHWEMKENNLVGNTRFASKEGDTIEMEQLKIYLKNDSIYYEPTVTDENESKSVKFTLTQYNENNHSFLFENPQHDFPTKIYYEFKSNLEIYAYVSGEMQGETKQMEIKYQKVK